MAKKRSVAEMQANAVWACFCLILDGSIAAFVSVASRALCLTVFRTGDGGWGGAGVTATEPGATPGLLLTSSLTLCSHTSAALLLRWGRAGSLFLTQSGFCLYSWASCSCL